MQAQMVRTTVYLPADLVALAKTSALNMGNTLTGLMREGLENKLKVNAKRKKKFVLKSYKLGNPNYVFRRADAYG
jgi:post-segregation antitoxin (ccd killing protein)